MSATEMTATAMWLLAALLGHGALWVEVVNRSHGFSRSRKVVDAVTAISGIIVVSVPIYALVLALMTTPSPDGNWPLGDSWLSGYAVACVAVLVILVSLRATRHLWDPHCQRRGSLLKTEIVHLGKRLGSAATGSPKFAKIARLPGNQLLKLHVESHDHHLAGLPTEADGLRIAHLTDLHMSHRLGVEYFREVVRIVNDWGPDLVCITGDIVEYTPQFDWIESTLGELQSELGTYFVLGNHDRKAVDAEAMRNRLTSAGLIHLGGKVQNLKLPSGVEIALCGDERPWFPAVPPIEETGYFTLALVHTPDRFGWAVEHGVDMVLAGHTHGGQVCFPLFGPLLCPSKHGVRYASGVFHHEGTTMHVSRGTGALFPLRYNCPPELGLLTLRC